MELFSIGLQKLIYIYKLSLNLSNNKIGGEGIKYLSISL
jgi:hypothetical protein